MENRPAISYSIRSRKVKCKGWGYINEHYAAAFGSVGEGVMLMLCAACRVV